MPLSHQQILDFVRQNGPSVPNDIRQALKAQDNFVVGAMLGELVSASKLKMTHFSLGTSRFYYDPEQVEALERVAHLQNEKDARATELLKQKQVLRNSELEPLVRVAMVNIPDYSRALRIQTPQGEELFWRYFLLPEVDARKLIDERHFGVRPKALPASATQTPPTSIRFGKKETSKPIVQEQPAKVSPSEQPAPKQSKPRRPREKKTTAPDFSQGFLAQVRAYFDDKQIVFLELVSASKNELSCVISIPSAVGSVTYFCKAKAKKTSSDGDLASALLEAQHHKLPLCYIAGGTLSKKALAIASSQLKGSVVVSPWA